VPWARHGGPIMALNLSQPTSVSLALSTTTTIIPADSAPSFPRRVIITAAVIANQSAAAATTVKIQSHLSTGITMQLFNLPAGATIVLPYNQDGWFQSQKAEGVDAVVGAGAGVNIAFNYTYS
jgi:hypothetical protein